MMLTLQISKNNYEYFDNFIPGWRVPVAAAHPIMGGMAPTTDPTHVLTTLNLFIGV